MPRPPRPTPRTPFRAAERAIHLANGFGRSYAPRRMRETGLPQVLTWRWAPCAALVLGSLSFVTFALVTIPDRIGHGHEGATSDNLRFSSPLAFSRSSTAPTPDTEAETTNTTSTTPAPPARVALRSPETPFPKRGFSPPLERPEPPPEPPPPPVLPPSMPVQPQLSNVTPPVPAAPPPAPEPPTPPPASEIIPQPQPAEPDAASPPAPDGEAPPTPEAPQN